MPQISVIVPVYKVEQYLRPCIDSILAQTFTDFELILVDDGSPDNCGAICDEYAKKDSRIQVIHQQNQGLSAARNAGIDIMQGEYVTFIDSDDMIHRKFLEALINSIKHSTSDIAVCGYCTFSDKTPADIVLGEDMERCFSGRDACRLILTNKAVKFVTACWKLYKVSLFEEIRYPVGMLHEDEATTYKLLYKADKVSEIDDELYYYRVNPDSIMNSTFSDKRYDSIVAFEERAEYYRQHGEQELYEQTKKGIPVAIAKLLILAKHNDAIERVPKQYRISVGKALKLIRKSSPDENYTYYLAMVHPNWLRPHAYIRKIRKMLHFSREC